MKLGKKIISSIKNIFSYAVHGESTEDRIRKPQAAQAVLEFSTYVTASGRVGYSDSLRAVLLQAPSKALGSGLIDYSQKMTVAAMQTAEKKV